LPRYPTLPAVRIGRLAVDGQFQGRGLAAAMPMNAVHRTLRDAAAAFTLLVDAKNDRAVAFYQHHGFLALESQPRTLFLPLAPAQKALLKKIAH
jgi:ribosomal protein S18 acetylase RimI-like enzyme